ncbi:MAG: PAS domain-containing protein, partial [Thermomicrobium sp.]|nr:PAS domain-containing protein [Thermomicrobium sp.]
MNWHDLELIIVDRDPLRSEAVSRLAQGLGVGRIQTFTEWPSALVDTPVMRPTVVLVDGTLLSRHALDLTGEGMAGRLFVAMLHGETGVTPEFLAKGFGAVLYDPITAVDLERVMALARSMLARERDRERRALVKLHALRQVEADLTLLAELTPDWITQSVRLLQRILEVPALAVWRVDWERDAIVCEGAIGLSDAFVRELERKARGRAADLVHKVLDSLERPVDMRVTSSDERVITDPATRRELGLEAGLVVPIRRAGRIVALLSVYLRRLDDFDRADVQLYDSAAEALAVAWAVATTRRELLLNQQLYRALVEEQPVGLLLCQVDGTIRLANGAAARLLGYERPERLLGLRFPEVIQTLAPLRWEFTANLESVGIQETDPGVVTLYVAQ